MLPAVIVTLATFLLELCSSSPVYNMQPAFITNTLGATTGRNIRNLPCISRKNNNMHGVCMFAIDCVKSNGTHLGTCIDRFYFGSCCLIQPVHDIIDNTIESDIIPHREPPLRLSNTTTTSTTISSTKPDVVETSSAGYSTTNFTSFESSTTETTTTVVLELFEQKTKAPTLSDYVVPDNETTTIKTSTGAVSTVETTTTPQKLQTFLVVDGSTVDYVTNKPLTTTKLSTTTPKPTTEPIQSKPSSLKPTSARPTEKPTPKPTLKPKPVRTTTKATPTKITHKPTKAPSKPNRTSTTKKPVLTTRTPVTVKTTRRPTKPTRKVTTTTTTSTTKTTVSTTTKTPLAITTVNPVNITLTTITKKPEDVTVKEQLVLTTTTVSNDIPVNKINVSQILETVNGNPATNEIEAAKPVEPLVTSKPELVTWTAVNDTTHTESSSTEAANTTTEDWVPITTPDGWVLLPSVEPNATNLEAVETTSSSVALSTSSPSTSPSSTTPATSTIAASTTEVSSTTTTTTTSAPSSIAAETKPSVTYIPLETTTQSIASSSEGLTTTAAPLNVTTPSSEVPSEGTTLPSDRPVNMSDFTDVCGRRMYPTARIVGGEKSSYGKWPWQISLRQWRTSTYLHKCGAALLNENWAVTAAHCVDQVPPSELLLRLGEHDLSTESEPYLHQERRVQIVASHPQFDPRTFEYDLALLRFYEPVTFQPNILPVCVPQTDENFVGRTAYVTGWGRLYENGPLPSILQEVSVPVINNTVCEGMYKSAGYIEHIPHIFICAGWRRGGFDSCEGDSGGPMVIQRDDRRFLLAGVISWGIGCAEPNQPGVYTRISEFRDWINQILQF